MAADFNVRKMCSAFERMDGCECAIEIIMVPFLEINVLLLTAERITVLKQWMTASSPVKINTAPFKEWMTAILSVTKT